MTGRDVKASEDIYPDERVSDIQVRESEFEEATILRVRYWGIIGETRLIHFPRQTLYVCMEHPA